MYLSENNLPWVSLIRGKLLPERYLHPTLFRLLFSTEFVVVSRIDCLGVTSV